MYTFGQFRIFVTRSAFRSNDPVLTLTQICPYHLLQPTLFRGHNKRTILYYSHTTVVSISWVPSTSLSQIHEKFIKPQYLVNFVRIWEISRRNIVF